MYLDLESDCIDFSAFVGSSSINESQWIIRINQWPQGFDNLAPQGCLQWFFGNVTGTVRSFNFDGGRHLANQNQNICVRCVILGISSFFSYSKANIYLAKIEYEI